MPLKLFKRSKSSALYIRGTFLGKRVYESTGTSNRKTAEILRARREAEIEREVQLGRKARSTFAQAAVMYMETGGEARFLGPIISYFGPDTLLKDIDQATVNKAARAIYPDAQPATINRQLITPISAVMRMAADNRLCEPSRLRRLPGDKRRLRWLTPEEVERLFDEISEPRFKAIVAFLLGTGARPSEAFKLDVKDLHLDTREAWFADTKTDMPRMVRFPERTLHYLRAADLPSSGHVFLTPKGAPYKERDNRGGQIKNGFDAARIRAGLDADVTPYVLRHTWATWFYASTKSFGDLMDLGGWKKADTANRYRKIAPANLHDRLLSHGWDLGHNPCTGARQGHLRVVK